MPVVYVSKQTRIRLDSFKHQYKVQKQISDTVAHIISDDVIIQELMNTVEQ